MEGKMQDIWKRIETWLENNCPHMIKGLSPAATDEQIRSAEQLLGIKFPDDLKESLSIHDGQSGRATPLVGEWQLFSLKYMVSDWEAMKALFDAGDLSSEGISIETTGPVLAQWWNPKWIGIATNGAGDLYCVDFDPAPGGSVGQIIVFWHMVAKRQVIANSFRAWLEQFSDDLQRGNYIIENKRLRKTI